MKTQRVSMRMLARQQRKRAKAGEDAGEVDLPPLPTRSVCRNGPRPCPHVRCRYHLMADVSHAGSLTLRDEDGNVDALSDTCALDVAERGAQTLEFISNLFGLNNERVRQIEATSVDRLRQVLVHQGLNKRDVREALAAIVSTERDMPPGGEAVYPFHKRRKRRKRTGCPA